MAVNLIDNEQIHVIQNGSDITLDIQADALKNDNVVVGSIRSKNLLRDSLVETSSSGLTLKNKEDGSTTITGTQSSSTIYFTNIKYIPVSDIETGNYTISFHNASYGNISYRLRKWNGSTKTNIQNETLLQTENYSLTLNLKNLIDNDTIQVELDIVCFGTNAKNVTLYPMIEKGSTATTYSPYQNLDNNEYVLWDGDTTSASITMNDDITNYKYIDVFFKSDGIWNCTRVYVANGTVFSLNGSAGSATTIWLKYSKYQIATNKLNLLQSWKQDINITNNTISSAYKADSSYITVARVVGYK